MSDRRAFYLELEAGPVLALLDRPAARASTTSVLIVPPFGWQDTSSYRSRRSWAQALAAAGHPTLRIDLPGTADSAGSPRDGALLEAWTAAVSGAARWLLAQEGCERVAGIGIGIGGLVLANAADAGAPLEALALWGVPARGRAPVRELRAFAALEAAQPVDPATGARTAVPQGAIAAAGFLLGAETARALSAVDLTVAPVPPGVGRVLLLERDGLAVDARLRARFEAAGDVELTVAPGPGYADMMMAEPHDAEPSAEVLAALVAWLAPVPAPRPEPRSAEPAPTTASSAAVVVGDTVVRETPFTVEQPFGELFGVLTEPGGAPAPVTAVLLNAGAQRRTGPNRMWVEVGRRWPAEHGVATLRLDLEGIGEADGEPKLLADVAGFYVPRYVEQVRAALDALTARGLPSRFILFGLCSGAYWSFHTGIEDPRIVAAFMLNPRTLLWDSWSDSARQARHVGRQLLSPRAWRRLLRGERPQQSIGSTIRSLLLRALAVPARIPARLAERRRERAVGGDPLDLALDGLRDNGTRGFVLFTEGEPLHEEWQREGRTARMGRWPNVETRFLSAGLEEISGSPDAHTLRPVWLQQQVHGLVDEALTEIVGELRGAEPASAAQKAAPRTAEPLGSIERS